MDPLANPFTIKPKPVSPGGKRNFLQPGERPVQIDRILEFYETASYFSGVSSPVQSAASGFI